MKPVHIISTSKAADLGYRALADVAAAAQGHDYRIIGGHMVQLLLHAYPTPEATERTTADADAGINRATAASQSLHGALIARGYRAEVGNRYVREEWGGGVREVDLLVPDGKAGEPTIINGRGFDAVPGLRFAFANTALQIPAIVHMNDGTDIEFTSEVPDVEAAIVLKALAWKSRGADKDASDILTLLEIVHLHKATLTRWGFGDDRLSGRGHRRDSAAVLHALADTLSRGRQPRTALARPARLAALIRAHMPAG